MNAFVLSRNGVSAGIYCQLYSQPWDRSYATKCSQSTTNSDGPTTRYDVASSYGYKANPQDGVLSTCKANPTTYKTAASSTTSKAATSTSTTAASTTSADQDGQGQNQMGESSKTTKASATATSTTMATSTTSANQDDQGQNQMSGSSSKTAKASATTTSKSNNQQR